VPRERERVNEVMDGHKSLYSEYTKALRHVFSSSYNTHSVHVCCILRVHNHAVYTNTHSVPVTLVSYITCTHAHRNLYIHIHMHIHTHTHTHTHTNTLSVPVALVSAVVNDTYHMYPPPHWFLLLTHSVPVTLVSAVVNDTPLVAMMIPIVVKWANKNAMPPSWFVLCVCVCVCVCVCLCVCVCVYAYVCVGVCMHMYMYI
jgi:hypothetical protein